MNQFAITTETACDLSTAFLAENDIGTTSLYVTMDGITYGPGYSEKISTHTFYEKMRQGSMPQTQQVNPEQAMSVFEPFLMQGQDILHIGFSSALSGSFNSCAAAAEELKEKYPDRKIIVIDTLSASSGQGLLVYHAVAMRKEGKTLEETAQWIEENKLHSCSYFTVDDLHHLQRGGRVSKTTAFIGSAIGIKPVLYIDPEGKLIPVGKIRGRKQSITALADNMEKKIGSYRGKNKVAFISHGDCLSEAEDLANTLKERFGVEEVVINYLGATLAAHAGPGTILLAFLGEER